MRLNGSQILSRCLHEEGVEVIFGIPGGTIMPLYDELHKHPMRHLLVRHEQAAAHMADCYARVKRDVGVCMGTSGPGATNLVTGILNAHMDSSPLVAITVNVPSTMIGTDGFQEADISGITIPVTKQNYFVRHTRDLAKVVKEAFFIARNGRPGPVHIDIPKDVLLNEAEFTAYPAHVDLPGFQPNYEGSMVQIRKAARLIEHAKRPVIIAGPGRADLAGSRGADRLRREDEHPGRQHAARAVQLPGLAPAVQRLARDARLRPLVVLARQGGPDHRDRQPLRRSLLRQVLGVRAEGQDRPHRHRPGRDRQERARGRADRGRRQAGADQADARRSASARTTTSGSRRSPSGSASSRSSSTRTTRRTCTRPRSSTRIYKATNGEALIVADVGQHQMFAAQYYRFDEPRMFQTSGGLGTMGYSLPGAIGAQCARPDKEVWAIAGDGCFQMNLQELAVLTQERIPVKIAVINNGYLGWSASGSSCSGPATTSTSISPARRTTSSWRMRTASRPGASRARRRQGRDRRGAGAPGPGPDRVPGLPRGERLPDGARPARPSPR